MEMCLLAESLSFSCGCDLVSSTNLVSFLSPPSQLTLPSSQPSYPPLPPDIALLSLYLHLEALHPRNMAEAPASTSENGLPVEWKLSNRRSRKSGCSNIFAGVNLHQLHRLFRTAGHRDAEHRAKLVWRGMDADSEGAEEGKEAEEEESEDEAGLAQALVGLRVRARNKAGIRAEGLRDHKWLRASGYLRSVTVSKGRGPVKSKENM